EGGGGVECGGGGEGGGGGGGEGGGEDRSRQGGIPARDRYRDPRGGGQSHRYNRASRKRRWRERPAQRDGGEARLAQYSEACAFGCGYFLLGVTTSRSTLAQLKASTPLAFRPRKPARQERTVTGRLRK